MFTAQPLTPPPIELKLELKAGRMVTEIARAVPNAEAKRFSSAGPGEMRDCFQNHREMTGHNALSALENNGKRDIASPSIGQPESFYCERDCRTHPLQRAEREAAGL